MTPLEVRERLLRLGYLGFCAAVFAFLVAPILVIVPLSFNAEPYFTFTEGMLRLDSEAYSLRWYRQIVEEDAWTRALGNSLVIGVVSTALATSLGTLAALGLSSAAMPARRAGHGTADLADGDAGDHLGGWDVLLLLEPRAVPDLPRSDPGARGAGNAVRGDYGDPRRCPPSTRT